MTAPDFVTQVTEVVSYGETSSFILTDITGDYNALTNTGGWGTPNLEKLNIIGAMVLVTPYKGADIPIVLKTDNLDSGSNLYWENVFDSVNGLVLDLTTLGLTEFVNGYWQFKIFYWPGYYDMAVSMDNGTVFTLGEIVRDTVSGATGYVIDLIDSVHIAWIQGTFSNTDTLVGLTSGATGTIDSNTLVGEIVTNEVYSYQNNQSILTATRNIIRKQPLDIVLPRINEKQALYVSMADFLLEALDDAVEVGQIENYITIFDFLQDFINRIDETYCMD